jgi:hypothetical protein
VRTIINAKKERASWRLLMGGCPTSRQVKKIERRWQAKPTLIPPSATRKILRLRLIIVRKECNKPMEYRAMVILRKMVLILDCGEYWFRWNH